MTLESSHIFEHLENKLPGEICRFEIIAPDFMFFCHLLQRLHSILSQSDQQEEIMIRERLRLILSEWFTNPVPFQEICNVVQIFDDREILKKGWGEEAACLYDEIVSTAQRLSKKENPLQKCIAKVMQKLKIHKKSFKIYCHKKSRPYFDKLFEMSPLEKERVYLHTLNDYKVSEIFDALIKVGPMRSFGWGSVPDAILSAPFFSTLLHFVWSGARDEASFGFDPITAETNNHDQKWASSLWKNQPTIFFPEKNSSEKDVVQERNKDVENIRVMDEISRIIYPVSKDSRRKPAILLEINQSSAYLVAQNNALLSYDPYINNNAFSKRKPGEDLTEGMFLILFQGNLEVDLGELQALEGEHGHKWKNHLKSICSSRKYELIKKLKSEGLPILDIESALSRWCQPASSVIPAPQTEGNFHILLSTMNRMYSESHGTDELVYDTAWIHRAWNEIRHSRGEAIIHGKVEQEIIEEFEINLLNRHLLSAQEQSRNHIFFNLCIKSSLKKDFIFSFYKIESIASGYYVLEGENKGIIKLEEAELWRE